MTHRPLSARLQRAKEARLSAQRTQRINDEYQKALDTFTDLEYTDCSDDKYEIERRFTLLDSVDNAGVWDSRTDFEVEEERREEHRSATESIKSLLRSAGNGTVSVDTALGLPEPAATQQKILLRSNTLYADYIAHKLGHGGNVDFMTFCESVGGRAFIRIMTRMKGRKELLQTFIGGSGNLPRLEDVQEFVVLDKHREKDPVKFVASLYFEVPGSKAVVSRILQQYADMVREEWRKMRVKPESPLPYEEDWLFEKAIENDPLELAVESYLRGLGLNKAAAKWKVSNRRLRDVLADRGHLRTKGGQ